MTYQREERHGETQHAHTDAFLTRTHKPNMDTGESQTVLTLINKQTWDIPLELPPAEKRPVWGINRGPPTFRASEDRGAPPLVVNPSIPCSEMPPVVPYRPRLLIPFTAG